MSSPVSPSAVSEVRDPLLWLGLTLTLVASGSLLAGGPELRFLPLASQLGLVTLTLIALGQAPPAFESAINRQAWQDLTMALRALWLESALGLFPETFLPPAWAMPARELLHSIFYGILVFAIERRRAARRAPGGPTLASDWAQRILLMATGLYAYFVVVPGLQDPALSASPVLFTLCALYLSARAVGLVRRPAARSQLQGSPIGPVLVAALAALLVGELVVALAISGPLSLGAAGIHGFLALTLLACRRRHSGRSLPEPKAEKAETVPPIGPGQITLLYAFALPLIHLGWEVGAIHGLLSTDAAKTSRETLLALWLPLVGVLAIFQHRRFHGQLLSIGRQRSRAENALRKSRASLALMVERQRNQRAVQDAELNFATIFRASPRGLLICSFPDLEILDANTRFSRLCQQPVQQLRGQHLQDLGLHLESSQIQRLRQETWLEGLEQDLLLPEDSTVAVKTTLELLGSKAGSTVLVVVRRARPALAPAGRGATEAVLRHPDLAVAACTHEGRIYLWNPGAEVLFGQSAADTMGQEVTGLVSGTFPEPRVRVLAPGTEDRQHGFLLLALPGQTSPEPP